MPAGTAGSPPPWHDSGAKIALQILHAGRYAYHPLSVSASSIKAPINPFRPRSLRDVEGTIEDFVHAAVLAREAGYDGVEIMGSEGYLLNQFLAPRTNKRTDAWGGTPEKRRRFPVEIVRLSDPHWVRKAQNDAADEINTCIACNQACLDHAFVHKTVSCLLNPRAGHETKLALGPTRRTKQVAAVDLRLGTRAQADELSGFDEVVLATGVTPRMPNIPGIDHPMVLSYPQAITGAPIGKSVAVIGAGGIGFDVSEFLVTTQSPTLNLKEWKAEWGVADPQDARGALTAPIPLPPAREVYLLQRTKGTQGRGLGKTSGWAHRASLKAKGVQQLSGVNYERIDDDGLHISFGSDRSDPRLLAVDNVIICAGQESVRELEVQLRGRGVTPHIIGSAAVAAELDAKRAIRQGTELAASL